MKSILTVMMLLLASCRSTPTIDADDLFMLRAFGLPDPVQTAGVNERMTALENEIRAMKGGAR